MFWVLSWLCSAEEITGEVVEILNRCVHASAYVWDSYAVWPGGSQIVEYSVSESGGGPRQQQTGGFTPLKL